MEKEHIKVLHVVTSFEDGGLEKVVALLVNNINNEYIKHYIISLVKSKSDFLLRDLQRNAVDIAQFNFHNRIQGFNSIIINLHELLSLSTYIKKKEIDVVHSHDFFPAFISRVSVFISYFFLLYRVKRIFITLHNLFFWLNGFHHKINKLLSYFTTNIICVSKSVLDYSLEKDKINVRKYKIIYNGIKLDEYIPSKKQESDYKKEFGILSDESVIGNVGVLSIRKGQKYLIEAFARILNDKKNIKLLIFGSEREHEIKVAEEIYELIKKNNLNDYVKIIQPRKDLNLIYNIFDVYVMPSITEGLSLSAIEAMLMRKICLFSDIAPFKEMVEDNVNGFLFKSEDVDALYNKLKYILENLDSLKSIGVNARNIALEKYDVKNMCREYEKLYLS